MGQENKLSKLILVVDDSTTMLVSMQVGLERNGFMVQTAHDGVDALAKINAGLRPDLIITDINMPNSAIYPDFGAYYRNLARQT